jgi:hypothetical protein
VWFATRHAVGTICLMVPAAAILWWQTTVPAAMLGARPATVVQAAPADGPLPPLLAPTRAVPRLVPPVLKPAPLPPPPLPKPLVNPPHTIKAVYFTGWSAGLKARVQYLLDLHKTTSINAVVIDIKDYSGNVSYRVAAPQARQYGAVVPMIRDIDALVSRLHDQGMYVIARITVFQDPVLANARPDLAVHRVSKLPPDRRGPLTKASLWLDRKGLAWIDPASRAAWEYVASIAKDALTHGFDELNFDYIRFPSDGNLKDMYFPHWDGKTPKHEVIRQFFKYLRGELPGATISADLFGLATVNQDDLGIGQVIEDAYKAFDYVCPMVYPSHFAHKFLGYPNPAAYPYEVVNYSIKEARTRLENLDQPKTGKGGSPEVPVKVAKLRPWLQDFNLGAKYNAPMVKAQIQAVEDALGDRFAGYMIWAPSNVYTRPALIDTPRKAQAAIAPPQAPHGAAQ